MPSDQSTWLISVPETGDADGLPEELQGAGHLAGVLNSGSAYWRLVLMLETVG